MRRAPTAFVALLWVVVGPACSLEPPPNTLEVRTVSPREVDLGDRWEIHGAGFPLRRTAHIRFVGRLLHPGTPAEATDFEVDVESRSEGRLTLPLDEQLVARFTGRGDRAAHATFRGEVRVSFDPVEAGTARLLGSAPSVVLDVRPGRLARSETRLAAEGGRLLAWMGVTMADQAPASGGLTVKAVVPGSAADSAGIASGDVIAEIDGLQVFRVSDLAPARDTVSLAVRRPGDTVPRLLVLRPPGLADRIPRDLLASAVATTFFALLAMLPFARGSQRVRAALGAPRGITSLASRAGTLALVGLVATSAAIALRVAPTDVDVAAGFLVGAFGVAALRSLGPRFSVIEATAVHLPAAIAIATTVLVTGSLRLADLAGAQGARPWEWTLARAPTNTLLLIGWALSVAHAEPPTNAPTRAAHALHLATFATLGSVMFLGGAHAFEADPARPGAAWLAAAAVLSAKALLLSGLVFALRRLSKGRGIAGAMAFALGGAGATLAWHGFAIGERLRGLTGPIVCALAGTFALVAALEVAYARRVVTVQHVDPHS